MVIAIGQEGVNRRSSLFDMLDEAALVIRAGDIELPRTKADVHTVDFTSQGIKAPDRALASLGILAGLGNVITPNMLRAALSDRFKDPLLASSLDLVNRVQDNA